MSARFPYTRQLRNLIPERDELNPLAHLLQVGAKIIDLSAFTCTVNARETYESGSSIHFEGSHDNPQLVSGSDTAKN
jgi:hypothetical protein